jgi:succinyl-diaminopimelate desuccinylase
MTTLDLAIKLIEFESTFSNPKETKKVLNFVEDYVTTKCKDKLLVDTYSHNNLDTLIISTKSLKNPKLAFYAHLDVVNASKKCFKPYVEDDTLYGRGSGDMKGPAASLINAFIDLVNQDPTLDICLLLPTDEESGGQNCIKALLENYDFRTDCVIMPDSGSGLDTIITNQKGIIFTEVTFNGQSSHGSRPWEGISAIELLMDYYQKLVANFPEARQEYFSTVNPSIISGGKSFNSVADKAQMTLDIRTANSSDHAAVLELLKSLDTDRITHTNKFIDPAFELPESHKYMQLAQKITQEIIGEKVDFKKEHGGSDGRFFQSFNIPCIVFGVEKKHTHGENEYASITEILQLEEFTKEFTKQFFSKAN